jgi:hypothetical protein
MPCGEPTSIVRWRAGCGRGAATAAAVVEEHVLRQRYCIRVDWLWAREINFRMIPDARDPEPTIEREHALGESVRSLEAIDGYLTIGDSLGQIRSLAANPWRLGLQTDWELSAFLGFMHFQGRAVAWVRLIGSDVAPPVGPQGAPEDIQAGKRRVLRRPPGPTSARSTSCRC